MIIKYVKENQNVAHSTVSVVLKKTFASPIKNLDQFVRKPPRRSEIRICQIEILSKNLVCRTKNNAEKKIKNTQGAEMSQFAHFPQVKLII